ncbi:hypothetical protein A3H22_04400 [Candidatus Peribacteria bacterium RIFCSPLOWO2_12_FULL_55_15]|nr:MAG: hypothetical protein A2789_01815 [Candidatus Peribacteria bacterium RIFCSPHIGHO2_01_FULL_54_22]OGJ62303.1 MAG: hypothetical protein A3D12_02075 [Candidatus Peribacteria bacterium RIFCSPHIGHO2_02_FULL_55_24]OGJ64664.1 MAG: hypothetical protein A3E47_00915 [Candidatus Peribacteria bacterium RIFCSPHIGHO2_12_FULL_54_10]OGJ67742.1 MAG: hypothetical protein A2947_03440 [Candidatus Peribacteria bacterium RIFCSPLOWO2_01_FULL_54_110]OGJ68884.1 MAG: hypothetical protein A3H90_01910 [Candidatus Pe
MTGQRVIIYTRKSTEQEERQALSIQAQQTELREFTAREQLTIVPNRIVQPSQQPPPQFFK